MEPNYGKRDGTATGTQEVIDLYPGMTSSFAGSYFALQYQLLFWAAIRQPTSELGLFITDGTAAGTQELVAPKLTGDNEFNWAMAYVANRLFFSRDDGNSGRELWTSDGSGAGTRLAVDLNPGSNSSFPGNFTELTESWYSLLLTPNTNRGAGLYISDGTPAGTVHFY